jgi:hypothetical protein
LNVSGSATLTNRTLSLNSANTGGGIWVNPSSGGGILNLTNTIVAGNTANTGPDIDGTVAMADHNLVGNATASSGTVNGVNGNIVGGNGHPVINPLLGPLQNNGGSTQTMALLPGSPAIGHADNTKAPATDQRGATRLDKAGETTDMGAFELIGTGSASTATFSLTPLGTAPATRTPVNTVAASEATSGHVGVGNANVRLVPFKNGDRAGWGTLDAALRIIPSESNNQKTAALDELFAWNMSSDVFGVPQRRVILAKNKFPVRGSAAACRTVI